MKQYNDFAERHGSTEIDWISIKTMFVGVIALVTFLFFIGVMADTLIGLIELI